MSDQSVCIVVIPIKRFLRFLSFSLSLCLSCVCYHMIPWSRVVVRVNVRVPRRLVRASVASVSPPVVHAPPSRLPRRLQPRLSL
jgi:hypothetical protein